jgi:ATP-binding cassette subfamily B (MDR/TAP) protein 1
MVIQSCIEVGAHSFIEGLPNGYETKVGDKGNHLSGGQKQRIGIARAIISSPKILIFDEATSGLDIESERIVEAAIQKVSKDTTTIIITHKLSLVQQADQIVLLKKGQVLEKGTHHSLLGMNGRYMRFYEAQQLEATIQAKVSPRSLEINDPRDKEEYSFDETFQPSKTYEDTPAAVTSALNLSLIQCLYSIIAEHPLLKWLFIAILPACILAGGVYPAQAIIFGHSVAGFDQSNGNIQKYENFWSLMWFIIALATFFVFLTMGTLSSIMGTTTKFYYQSEYFKSMLYQDPAFFDQEKNAVGSLVASLSLHTNQMQNLLTVLGSLLVALVACIYCSVLALVIEWRLALVGLFGSVPVVVLAGYLRVLSAAKKSKSLSEPLLNSAHYASEAIGAVRTVAALTMEREVCLQLDRRMQESVPIFYKNIFKTMPLFAFSESGPFLGRQMSLIMSASKSTKVANLL